MRVTEIASALPDLKKTDKKLDKYLKSKSRSIGFFKPENYFNNTKSKFLNVKTDDLKLVVKQFKKTDKKIVRKFADFLWKQNVFEKKSIAVGLYYYCDLELKDFGKIVNGFDNWAHCDSFATKVSGPYFAEHPKQLVKLRKFALSKNPWKRRFAAVSLVTTLKDPEIKHDVALDILSLLVPDESQREVLAAADWMIREYVKKNYKKGFSYMYDWALYVQKTGDKKVRWVLVRARHKLNEKEKKVIEKLIGMK